MDALPAHVAAPLQEALVRSLDAKELLRAFRAATSGLIGEIRAAVGALDLHRIPRAGHWSAYENAPEVNRLMLEFFSS